MPTLQRLLAALAIPLAIGSGRFRDASIETLASVGGLPAHVAGAFTDMGACEQSAAGEYFVFDRRAHAVFSVAPPYESPREIVRIGAEAGRLLQPTAFALATDGSFVVADAPNRQGRIQVFLTSGANVGGFRLSTRDVPTMVMDNFMRSGVASLAYTGQSILISQPELGALMSEYGMDGTPLRSFGTLRETGHEQDRDLHLALNTGVPIVNPRGGYYFVFLGGTPLFRKYDARGTLLFERHVEGVELDEYVRTMPTSWPRRQTDDGTVPIVQPAIRAAGADPDGNLWISLRSGFSYVYDGDGDKWRVLQFKAAGTVSPASFFFTRNRVLVTPGCYAFDRLPAPVK